MKIQLSFILFMSGMPLCALQGSTPQAALEEIASATQPEVIARHLPEPVQKSIEALPRMKKQAILNELLKMKSTQLQDCTVRPAQGSEGWEIIDENGEAKGKVRLENAFFSGVNAMLPLQIEFDGGAQSIIVTMHFEDDEWRIDDFGPWEKTELGLAKLLHEPTEMEKNEAAAKDTLRGLAQSLGRYAIVHPEIGYPSGLKALMEGPGAPLRRHAQGVLDESFAADPLIKNGYRFRYLLTETGDGTAENLGAFEITAVPVEFGKTGAKGFMINETGRIHVTTENRPATADDPARDDEGVGGIGYLQTVIYDLKLPEK